MPGIAIEGGLELIDGSQVRERGIRTRTALAYASDDFRQIAVWIADLNGGSGQEETKECCHDPLRVVGTKRATEH